MSRTVTIAIGDRGPVLTEDEQDRVDSLVSRVAEALKGLTVHEMAEVTGRIITEHMSWATLAGQTRQEILADVLTRAEAYGHAMDAATQVLYSKFLSRPGAAEELVQREGARLREPGATPRTMMQERK